MREPAPVVVDPVRGHIAVGELVFCDIGQVLDVWTYSGATLTPATAGELGRALVAWSGKKFAPSG